jgi:hypothetical protein
MSPVAVLVREANSTRQKNGHKSGSKTMEKDEPQAVQQNPQRKRISVYLLWHTDRLGDEKLIGVYKKRADASSAIERARGRPGFSEEGGFFEIARYELNKDHWAEGFHRREGFSLPTWLRPTDSTG